MHFKGTCSCIYLKIFSIRTVFYCKNNLDHLVKVSNPFSVCTKGGNTNNLHLHTSITDVPVVCHLFIKTYSTTVTALFEKQDMHSIAHVGFLLVTWPSSENICCQWKLLCSPALGMRDSRRSYNGTIMQRVGASIEALQWNIRRRQKYTSEANRRLMYILIFDTARAPLKDKRIC